MPPRGSDSVHQPQDRGFCMVHLSDVMLLRSGVGKLGRYGLFLLVSLVLIHGVTTQSIIRASVLKVKMTKSLTAYIQAV